MAYTTESFIKKVAALHNGKYDYSKVDYKGCNKKVTIICPIHGEFQQTPMLHIQGCGCPKCGKIKSSENNKQNKEEWVKKAKEIHGNKYDYSKVVYKGWDEKVCIICPIHGEFWQNPTAHIAKHQQRGCPECGKIKCGQKQNKTTEEFIKDAIKVHGDKFNYHKTAYISHTTKICVTCKKHGDIWITPKKFLKKGCIRCNKEEKLLNEKNFFLKKANKKYNGKYDYSKINYKGKGKPITIICPIHGEFQQTPSQHLNGKGCHECWKDENLLTYEKCLNKAKLYQYKIDFNINDKKAYNKSIRENWIKDFTWLIEKTTEGDDRTIYVYEFQDNSAYVGLTNWIEHRDYQHRWGKRYSSVYEYSVNNNIEIPPVKILEENVNSNNAGNTENKWINFYRNNGWKIINKVKGGALGATNGKKYTKDIILEETKQYKNQEDLYNNNRPLYNAMRKFKLVRECFPKTKFKPKTKEQYEYTENFLNEIVRKYPKKSDLRKKEYRVYHWLYEHNRLYDFYEKASEGNMNKKKKVNF